MTMQSQCYHTIFDQRQFFAIVENDFNGRINNRILPDQYPKGENAGSSNFLDALASLELDMGISGGTIFQDCRI